MTISNIQVKRRPFVSQNGWIDPGVIASSKSTPSSADVTEVKENIKYIPTFQELVFDIYDKQREILSSVSPKRYKSKIPLPVKAVERLYHHNPNLVTFDGMSHQQALEHFRYKAREIGIRNEFCIPFIFADKICIKSHAFTKGYAFVFEIIDGMRYQTVGTSQEFFWLSSNRQILSNLSYCLDQKYNCNLHIAYDESVRAEMYTGKSIEHNRHLYTRACDYYTNPQLLSIHNFIRCQVKALREYNDVSIDALLKSDDDSIMALDPILAYEIDRAKAIYFGKIKQWVGDFSHELMD